MTHIYIYIIYPSPAFSYSWTTPTYPKILGTISNLSKKFLIILSVYVSFAPRPGSSTSTIAAGGCEHMLDLLDLGNEVQISWPKKYHAPTTSNLIFHRESKLKLEHMWPKVTET